MKKILLVFALILTLSMACLAFTACGDDSAENLPSCQHRDADDNSVCDKCGAGYTDEKDVDSDGQPHVHIYSVEDHSSKYLKSAATDYSPAVYYKSCSCGKASTIDTFTYGESRVGRLKYTLSADSSFYYVSGYEGVKTEVEIPNEYDGLRVIGIAANAFEGNTTIKRITMPNSINDIGTRAFADCTALESITIPTSVTNIASYAFSGCTSLKTVTLHSKVEVIGNNTFEKCSSLRSITLNSGLKTISDNAFDYCTALESISIPDTVTTLGNMAFRHAESLRSIKFSKAMTSIGNAAFQYCTSLDSVELPSNIKSLGNSTFSYCDNLRAIRILGSLNKIGNSTFYECQGLESIYFASKTEGSCVEMNYLFYNAGIKGKGITLTIAKDAVIPEGFFEPYYEDNMPKITKIVIESGSTKVNGFEEKNNLPYLESIVYPSTITDPCYGIFNNSPWWENQPEGEVYISGIFYGYKCSCKIASLKAAVEENRVAATCTTNGGYDSVIYCSVCRDELKRTHNVITKLGHTAKAAVEENRVAATCTKDGKYDSVVYCKTCNAQMSRTTKTITKLGHTENAEVEENKVAATCTKDGHYDSVVYCKRCNYEMSRSQIVITKSNNLHNFVGDVCEYCGGQNSSAGLKYTLNSDGKGYTVTGKGTFSGSSLVIDLYNNLPVTSIGYRVFYDCTGLKSVTIGNSVTSIGKYAFRNCTGLKSVTMGNGVTSIGGEAFWSCTSLTSVYITDIAAWCNISFGDYNANPLYYAKKLYLNRTLVTELIIPDSVTSIGYCAFRNCTSLKSVTIPDNVTNIGSSAFSGCTSLTSVTIGDSVTSIGSSAFYNCYKLVEVIDLSSLKITAGSSSNGYVGYYAEEVHKGESKIVNYNDYLFYTYNGVNYLLGYVGEDTALVLPESYKGENYKIYNHAFAYCISLTSVTIPDSVKSIGVYAFRGCTGLTSVTIPDSVTSIGEGAFYDCTGLKSATIGNSVTNIGYAAFRSCTGLKSVTIGNSVTSIGGDAFCGCKGLTSVIIPNSVTSIGSYVFAYCTSITSIKYRGTEAQWNAISKGSECFSDIGSFSIIYNYNGN